MNKKFIVFVGSCLLLGIPNVEAQFSKGWSYETEAGVTFSGGEHTPFWLTANRQGLSSIEKNNGYIRRVSSVRWKRISAFPMLSVWI